MAEWGLWECRTACAPCAAWRAAGSLHVPPPCAPAAGSVEEASVKDAALAAAAAADEAAAASVGLHLRGRATFVDGATNEDDPARFDFNRRLREAAMGGSVDDAEAVLAEMTRAGLPPGPRAYHALVFAFVKHRQPSGALAAIRRSWDAGITPMPETYAAVVAAHVAAGDLDTAEAVLASNRRAGVDCTKSWQQLVLGLLRAKQGVRAMEAYSQVRAGCRGAWQGSVAAAGRPGGVSGVGPCRSARRLTAANACPPGRAGRGGGPGSQRGGV